MVKFEISAIFFRLPLAVAVPTPQSSVADGGSFPDENLFPSTVACAQYSDFEIKLFWPKSNQILIKLFLVLVSLLGNGRSKYQMKKLVIFFHFI